jgi:endonuclease/exonuclease/phosphatase family metal-dependent hydrolase
LNELAATLAGLDADVIGLQEVRRHQARHLSRTLGFHCVWTFKHNGYSRLLPRFAEGLAIMSRWPIGHDGDAELSDTRSRSDFRRRVVTWGAIEHPDGEFVLANTHLASGDAPEDRETQARRLHDIMSRGFLTDCERHDHQKVCPNIVTGDLNDHLEPNVVQWIGGDLLRDAWSVALTRSRNGLTNPTSAPHQRLDHVLVPEQWPVLQVEVPDASDVWARRSDHLPVIATVQMRSK